MQWFKIPERIYFEAGSISYLEKMPEIMDKLTKLSPFQKELAILKG